MSHETGSGELSQPQTIYFEGTTVPQLDLERDAWLTLVVPLHVEVSQQWVERLNDAANRSLGGPATRAFIGSLPRDAIILKTPQAAMARGANDFGELIAVSHPESPFCGTRDATSDGLNRPLGLVVKTRVLYAHVGEKLPMVIEAAVRNSVYSSADETVLHNLNVLLDHSFDVGNLLLSRVGMLRHKFGDTKGLLAKANAATKHKRLQDNRQDRTDFLEAPFHVPRTRTRPLSRAAQARYDRLANAVGLPAAELARDFPGVKGLNRATFGGLVTGLENLAEAGTTILPRHWFRLAPGLEPDSKDT